MADESYEREDEQGSDEEGYDPEVPLVPAHTPTGTDAYQTAEKTYRATEYIKRVLLSMSVVLGWLRRRVIANSSLWTAAATVVIAVATVFYTHYARKQWEVMNSQLVEITKQYPELQKSSNAAKSAADTAADTLRGSKESFRIEQRPYMVVEKPEFLNPPAYHADIEANITFKNIGKSPAIKARREVSFIGFAPPKRAEGVKKLVVFLEGSFREIEDKLDKAERERYYSYVREDVAPTNAAFSTKELSKLPDYNEFNGLKTGDYVLWMLGSVRYTDSSGGNYETQFCFSWFGADPKVWHICDSHNAIK